MPHPGTHNPMDSQQPQQPQQPGIARPIREHLQAAMAHITKLKSDYCSERMLANAPAIDVPAEQRMEYNTVLEKLHRACIDLDHKLPMLFVVLKKEEVVRRLVIIVQTAIQQRAMISSCSTRFLVTLETLRTMLQQVQHMNESFATILAGLVGKGPMPPGGPMGGMPPRPSLNHPLPPPQINQLNQPPPIPPQPTNSLPPQQQLPNRPGISLQRPLNRVKRPGTASSPNAPSPTPPPVASESTAVNNAPTPRDMSSPHAPKCPKGKPKPKPPQKRKPSIEAAAAPPLPPPEPATAPSPAGSNKRAREDEATPPQHNMQRSTSSNAPGSSAANESSPSKRQKTEWDGRRMRRARSESSGLRTSRRGKTGRRSLSRWQSCSRWRPGTPDRTRSRPTFRKPWTRFSRALARRPRIVQVVACRWAWVVRSTRTMRAPWRRLLIDQFEPRVEQFRGRCRVPGADIVRCKIGGFYRSSPARGVEGGGRRRICVFSIWSVEMGQSDAISGLIVGHLQLIVFSMVGFYRLFIFLASLLRVISPSGVFFFWSPTCTFGYK
ncbi:hypothetical protein B0H14DRAFT_444077 [Mycena olivaceomarginata]|nr:hypothetical protein B0H14DRAFT_444077 [Mycena olivaceomarginata]